MKFKLILYICIFIYGTCLWGENSLSSLPYSSATIKLNKTPNSGKQSSLEKKNTIIETLKTGKRVKTIDIVLFSFFPILTIIGWFLWTRRTNNIAQRNYTKTKSSIRSAKTSSLPKNSHQATVKIRRNSNVQIDTPKPPQILPPPLPKKENRTPPPISITPSFFKAKLNINSSTFIQIKNLSNLLTSMDVRKIIQEREKNGAFVNINDLQRRVDLPGILIKAIEDNTIFIVSDEDKRKDGRRIIDL